MNRNTNTAADTRAADDAPTWEELVAEGRALLAESKAMRCAYLDRRATNNGYKPRPR